MPTMKCLTCKQEIERICARQKYCGTCAKAKNNEYKKKWLRESYAKKKAEAAGATKVFQQVEAPKQPNLDDDGFPKSKCG